jgi:hypothetical protein
MRVLAKAAPRTLAALWVAALAFMALAQPAHAVFAGPVGALLGQMVGATCIGVLFAFWRKLRRSHVVVAARSHPLQRWGMRARAVATDVRSTSVAPAAPPESAAALLTAAPTQWVAHSASGLGSVASAGTSPRTAAFAPPQPRPPSPLSRV